MAINDRTWRVGDVAVATGLTVRALHHYDQIGLVVPSERTATGHRLYTDADLRRLYLVTALRQLGLSLEQVGKVLAADVPVRDVIDEQLEQVDRQIRTAKRLREQLLAAREAGSADTGPGLMAVIKLAQDMRGYLSDEQIDATRRRMTELGVVYEHAVGVEMPCLYQDALAEMRAGTPRPIRPSAGSSTGWTSCPACCADRTSPAAPPCAGCGLTGRGSALTKTAVLSGARWSPIWTRHARPAEPAARNGTSGRMRHRVCFVLPETRGTTLTKAPAPASASSVAGGRTAGLLGLLLGDLAAPIAIFYGARAAGASTGLALVLGGAVCLPRQLAEVARKRRLDGLGVAVLVSFALGGVLSLVSGDARVLVVKDAIWPVAAGLVVGASCLRGKPVTFFIFRPMLTQGRAANRPFWDGVWAAAAGAPFRRCLRVLAVVWTVVLLAAGAVELTLAFTLPLSTAAAAPTVVHVLALAVLLGFTGLYAKSTGLGVRRSLEAGNAEDAR